MNPAAHHHGHGALLSVLEGLSRAHSLQTEHAPHGMLLKVFFHRVEPSATSAKNSPAITVSRAEMLSRHVCSGTELKCEGLKSLSADSECEKSKSPPAEFKCDEWKSISAELKCDELMPLPEGSPLEVTKAIDKMLVMGAAMDVICCVSSSC